MLQLRCVPPILLGLCLLFIASPRLVERRILWNNLKILAYLHNLPWLMLGDSNEVLCREDKFGGNHVNLNRALDFKNCLDECKCWIWVLRVQSSRGLIVDPFLI